MLDKIPTRISDSLGNVGDRVNFLIVGSEAQVHRALDTAGWIQPDKSIKNAFMRGAFESFSKEAYVTMPISDLMLFGRKQDFGYAQADPIKVIASRHHFRLWRAPFDVEGQPLWAGAGTHDIGLEKDQRNGKLTHKIDPAVDGERDYIGQSLQQTGLVAKSGLHDAFQPRNRSENRNGRRLSLRRPHAGGLSSARHAGQQPEVRRLVLLGAPPAQPRHRGLGRVQQLSRESGQRRPRTAATCPRNTVC